MDQPVRIGILKLRVEDAAQVNASQFLGILGESNVLFSLFSLYYLLFWFETSNWSVNAIDPIY